MSGHPGLCPVCFASLDQGLDVCPACGARMADLGHRDYQERLCHALHHPIAEVRMRAIIALGLRAEPSTAKALVDCAWRHPIDVVQGIEIVRRIAGWRDGPARRAALTRLAHHPSKLVGAAVARLVSPGHNDRGHHA